MSYLRCTALRPFVVIVAITTSSCASARTPAPVTPPVSETPTVTAPRPQSESQARPKAKSYEDVITKEAVTDDGLFKVHALAGKVFYEIPDSIFGRDMYLISRASRVPNEMTDNGQMTASHVVRWERRDKQVLLRRATYGNVADTTLAIYKAVAANNLPPILAAFTVETTGPGNAAVIDVTKLFITDMPTFGGLQSYQRDQLKVRRLDPERTFIDRARSYPLNVEIRHTLTYETTPTFQAPAGAVTIEANQSLILLPKVPMRPRFADARVGFISSDRVNFGLDEQKAASQTVIHRFRLEPSDPAAYARGEVVAPVKPIVYYVDAATPAKWAPYVKQGIEDWQVAFEAAGFKNGIVGKYAPTAAEDPEYDVDDVRYTTVRWIANMTRNANGGSVVDPRSGESIRGIVNWYHNHLRSYRNRLLIETGASNPQIKGLDVPDELLG